MLGKEEIGSKEENLNLKEKTANNMHIKFKKMHGLGNDFVVIDNLDGNISLTKEQVIFLCDRHKGVGADGVILVEKSEIADCFMNYYNSDGTWAEMCGNGVRCVARFLKEELAHDVKKSDVSLDVRLNIDTRAGVKEIKYQEYGAFSVNMGRPSFSHLDFPEKSLELEGLLLHFVSVGNPHAVAFVNNIDLYNLEVIGPLIENNPHFPHKINLEIVEEKGKNEFRVKVWERGCGLTLACGTGACAVFAIIRKYKNNVDTNISGISGTGISENSTIQLPGGNLILSENGVGDIIMSGPAVTVFSSEVII